MMPKHLHVPRPTGQTPAMLRTLLMIGALAILATATFTATVGIEAASAATVAPITIDGDPCGADDWETVAGVSVADDQNSANGDTLAYDCATNTALNCTEGGTDDLLKSGSKWDDLARPRETAEAGAAGRDMCQSLSYSTFDSEGDYWVCSAASTTGEVSPAAFAFEFNQVTGELTAGDLMILVQTDNQGNLTTNLFVFDGGVWVDNGIATGFAVATNADDNVAFVEGCINLTDLGVVAETQCAAFASMTGFTRTGNALSAGLKDTGGDVALDPTNPACGTLIVTKATVPAGSADSFTYTINGSNPDDLVGNAAGLGLDSVSEPPATGGVLDGDGSTHVYTDVFVGNPITIAEVDIPDPWLLRDITCSTVTADGSLLPPTTTGEASMSGGGTTTCTITNERFPVVTVEKIVDPSDAQDSFPFSATFGTAVENFTLLGGQTWTHPSLTTDGTLVIEEALDDQDLWELTALTCTSDDTDVGTIDLAAGTATLDIVAGGSDIHCLYTNTELAELTIVKVVEPTDSAETFPILVNGTLFATLGHEWGSTDQLLPGTYTITEDLSALPNWHLMDITCITAEGTPVDHPVELTAGQSVECLVSNALGGTVTVEKIVEGTPTDFDFTAGSETFVLTPTGAGPSGKATQSWTQAPDVTVAVAEGVPAGYYLDDLTCTSTAHAGSDFYTMLSPSSVSLTPASGEEIVCTYTNVEYAELTVIKEVTGTGGSFDFESVELGDFTIDVDSDSSNQVVFTDLEPGSITVTEPAPAGFEVRSVVCTVTSPGSDAVLVEQFDTGDMTSGSATVELGPGDDAECTFSNQAIGTVVVEKVVDGGPDGNSFEFTSTTGLDATLAVDADSSGSATFAAIESGLYDVSELGVSTDGLNLVTVGDTTYVLTSQTCDSGDPVDAIVVEAGDVITCTFVNAVVDFELTKEFADPDYEDVDGSEAAIGILATPGDRIHYLITLTNTGQADLTGATIQDVELGISHVCPSPLAPGEACVLGDDEPLFIELTQAMIDAGVVVNTAVGDSEQTDPKTGEKERPLVQVPGVRLTKTADPSTDLVEGDEVTFSLVGTNIGNVTLTDVEVADPLEGLSELDCDWPAAAGVLAPDESVSCTATYIVTAADVIAGEILNVATITASSTSGEVDDDDDHTITTAPPPVTPSTPVPVVPPAELPDPPTPTPTEVIEDEVLSEVVLATTGANSNRMAAGGFALMSAGSFLLLGLRMRRQEDE